MSDRTQQSENHSGNPHTTPMASNSSVPFLLTETELIEFLRIPEVSAATDYGNVIDNLKRMHGLPCIHICNRCLYPRDAIEDWVREKTKECRR